MHRMLMAASLLIVAGCCSTAHRHAHGPGSARGGAGTAERSASVVGQVERALDDFHNAASKADFDRYFGHFAEEGVFLGTDPEERWTVEQFKAYAKPHFAKGEGWTYTPIERHVVLAPCGRIAWFDEKLSNDKYGLCRGTGVLTFDHSGAWRIRHYSLTFLIGNGVAEQATKLGR